MAGKVLTLAQQKGGAGKTTLVAQLAVAFGARGKSVALVDIDPQGSLTRWFKAREEAASNAQRYRCSMNTSSAGFNGVCAWRAK